jgi:glycolate oxidase
VKNVVGYDLTRLMVGSEGTLGVITEITLKLIPLPRARSTVLAFFPSVASATQAVSQILSSGILPSAMEIVDRASLECVAMSNPVDYPQDTGAMLLVEVDGPEAATKEEARNVAEISREVSALRVVVSQDEKDSESLWKLRRAISPSLARLRPHRLNEDVVVPRSKLAEAMETFRKIGEEYGVPLTTFGHAGDGNIHVNVLYDRSNEDEATRAEKAARRVMEATVALGGSLSGEHGIGITKSQFLPLEVQPEALELMKKVKSLLDPKGILNPGKIFPQDKG